MKNEGYFDNDSTQEIRVKGANTDVFTLIPKQLLALNAIAPYYTMFPIQFPLSRLRKASIDDWVLDPFCGRGTTMYACRLLGLSSVGIDADPVAVAITKSKLVDPTPERILKEAKNIINFENSDSLSTPEGEFWDLAFDHKTLVDICNIRNTLLNNCKSDVRIALRGLMLGALHGPKGKHTQSYFSNQMPRTYTTKPDSAIRFWKKHKLTPARISVLNVIEARASRFYSNLPSKTKGNAYLHDSRKDFTKQIDKKFKWIITSPPYLGMNDYGINQWLREWFIGGPEYPDYRSKNRLASGSTQKFESDLKSVWKNVSALSEIGASLVIRFGSLPSKPYDFKELIQRSLEYNGSDWIIEKIEGAGFSDDGQRQSKQFWPTMKSSLEEIDVYARKVS